MKIPLVDLQAQYRSIKEEIDGAINDVLSNAAFIGGYYVQRFEEDFSNYCGCKYCIGVGNGTDALFIALKALGLGRGDEVITTAFSFIATSEAITMSGARPIFVDVNPKTYNIDVSKIEEKITNKTKVILPVHLYGQPAEMDHILALAAKYHLRVVEDAAQAHGAEFKSKKMGTMGDLGCYSFYPGKNLGAYGDAGAIITNNEELAIKARMICNHGRIDKYNHEFEGVNSRLDGVQAAILTVKLKHLDHWIKERSTHALNYCKLIMADGVILPQEWESAKSAYHLFVIRVDPAVRSTIQRLLADRGISTGVHYPTALTNMKAYEYLHHSQSDFPEATLASRTVLSLPIYPELTTAQVQYISETLNNIKLEEMP